MNQFSLRSLATRTLPLVALAAGSLLAGALGAAPAQAATSAGDGEAWSLEANCAACHATQAQSIEDESAPYALHALLGLEDCATCHDDGDGKLTKAHAKYLTSTKTPTRLSKSTVAVETCTTAGCHTIDDLIEQTAESAVLTDEKGTEVNAHAMLLSETHETAKITCASCHTMHSGYADDQEETDASTETADAAKPLESADDETSAAHAAIVENSMKACETCHHEGVFECYTCHS